MRIIVFWIHTIYVINGLSTNLHLYKLKNFMVFYNNVQTLQHTPFETLCAIHSVPKNPSPSAIDLPRKSN